MSSQLVDAVPGATLPYADGAVIAGTKEVGAFVEDQTVDGSYEGSRC